MPHFRPGGPDNIIVLQNAPRRLRGLTAQETAEFEKLDALTPLDASGAVAWAFEGKPRTQREKRWLELFNKIKK